MGKKQYVSPVPDARKITPEMCGNLALRLESVVELLEAWEIRVPIAGRIQAELALLRDVAASSRFPKDGAKLLLIGNAIRVAMDFHQISRWIGTRRSEVIAKDIDRLVRGTAHQTEQERKPYQFQSQFWFGAMLDYAGLSPRVPEPTDNKRPDFVVTHVTTEYGAEVKRPESEAGIRRALSSAAGQLDAADMKGVIAIDLSDCLNPMALQQLSSTVEGAPYDAVAGDYRRMRESMAEQVYDRRRQQPMPGFRSLMVLFVFARGFRWDLANLNVPDPFVITEIGAFSSTLNSLHHIHGIQIRDLLTEGMTKSGLYISHSSGAIL